MQYLLAALSLGFTSVKARIAYCLYETMAPRPRWSEKHEAIGTVGNILKLVAHVALCILGTTLFGCHQLTVMRSN